MTTCGNLSHQLTKCKNLRERDIELDGYDIRDIDDIDSDDEVTYRLFKCDVCQHDIPREAMSMSCGTCRFDCCMTCYKEK